MFHVNATSGKPIYEQIMDQVKEGTLKGYLNSGDSLPSVRKLAMSLSVTPNTVAKAYQLLEKEKVIVTIRGKGAFIAERSSRKIDTQKIQELKRDIRGNLLELRYLGLDEKKIIALVQDIYKDLEGE